MWPIASDFNRFAVYEAHLHITSFQPQNNRAIIAVCSQGWTLRLRERRRLAQEHSGSGRAEP